MLLVCHTNTPSTLRTYVILTTRYAYGELYMVCHTGASRPLRRHVTLMANCIDVNLMHDLIMVTRYVTGTLHLANRTTMEWYTSEKLSFHRAREAIVVSGMISFCYIPGTINSADILSKLVVYSQVWEMLMSGMGRRYWDHQGSGSRSPRSPTIDRKGSDKFRTRIITRDCSGNITRKHIFISLSHVSIFGFCLGWVTSLPLGHDPVFKSMTRFYVGYVMYHSVLVTRLDMVTSCPIKYLQETTSFTSCWKTINQPFGKQVMMLPLEESRVCRLTSAHLKNTLTSVGADIRSSALVENQQSSLHTCSRNEGIGTIATNMSTSAFEGSV